MRTLAFVLCWFFLALATRPAASTEAGDDAIYADEIEADAPAPPPPRNPPPAPRRGSRAQNHPTLVPPATTVKPPPGAPTPTEDDPSWFVIAPAFVIHGLEPTGGANLAMPRRIVPDGRAVATPGVGLEYQGRSSFEFAIAFVKDCYDNPAGALQFGQHFRLSHAWDVGYSVGVYMRQTPIACFTQTLIETQYGAPTPPVGGINLGGGRRGQPTRTNTLTSTSCAFEDNLPLRYTTRVGSGYMDIIPTPFVHASTRVLQRPLPVWVKFISNFYLSVFGLEVPF